MCVVKKGDWDPPSFYGIEAKERTIITWKTKYISWFQFRSWAESWTLIRPTKAILDSRLCLQFTTSGSFQEPLRYRQAIKCNIILYMISNNPICHDMMRKNPIGQKSRPMLCCHSMKQNGPIVMMAIFPSEWSSLPQLLNNKTAKVANVWRDEINCLRAYSIFITDV